MWLYFNLASHLLWKPPRPSLVYFKVSMDWFSLWRKHCVMSLLQDITVSENVNRSVTNSFFVNGNTRTYVRVLLQSIGLHRCGYAWILWHSVFKRTRKDRIIQMSIEIRVISSCTLSQHSTMRYKTNIRTTVQTIYFFPYLHVCPGLAIEVTVRWHVWSRTVSQGSHTRLAGRWKEDQTHVIHMCWDSWWDLSYCAWQHVSIHTEILLAQYKVFWVVILLKQLFFEGIIFSSITYLGLLFPIECLEIKALALSPRRFCYMLTRYFRVIFLLYLDPPTRLTPTYLVPQTLILYTIRHFILRCCLYIYM